MDEIHKLNNPDSLIKLANDIRWVVKIDILDSHILICLIREQLHHSYEGAYIFFLVWIYSVIGLIS
jgi:hypothetical protein